MAGSAKTHVLDPLFAWAHRKHQEASEQPSFHGELTMRIAYVNGRITIIEKRTIETDKPTN